MKKFFINFIVLAVLLFTADRIVGVCFRAIDHRLLSYPIGYHNSYEKTMAGCNSEDMIIIGHSRARHHYIPTIIQDSLGITVVNAAKDGTGFLTQAILINGMLQHCTPKYVLWEVRPNIFHKSSNRDIDRLTDLFPFYDTDSLSHVYAQRRCPYEKYKLLSYAYRNNGRFWGRIEQLIMGREDNGLKGYCPTKSSNKYPEFKHYDYEDAYDISREDLFVMVADNVSKSGAKLVMAISPQYETSNAYDLTETNRFFSVADSLGVPVLDFFYDSSFMIHPEWFKDHTHLNADGAIHYMQILIPELKQIIDDGKQQ